MLVLSMLNDTQRRNSIKSQCDSLAIAYEFFDAYTPLDIPNDILLKSNKDMTKGELACAYSHLMMYQKIIHHKKSFEIIVEDDAFFDKKISIDFDELEKLHSYYDVIILGYSKVDDKLKKHMKFIRPSLKRYIENYIVRIPYKQWHCGTVAYSISLNGAKKLLDINYDLKAPADYWDLFECNGLKVAHYREIIVTEKFNEFSSHIEHDRKTFKNPILLKRYIGGLLRHLYLPITYFKSKKI